MMPCFKVKKSGFPVGKVLNLLVGQSGSGNKMNRF